jgi:hypothetical protein
MVESSMLLEWSIPRKGLHGSTYKGGAQGTLEGGERKAKVMLFAPFGWARAHVGPTSCSIMSP